MKKSILAIGLTALLFGGCKKEEVEEFLATDMTGNAVLSGNVTKNILSQNMGFGYTTVAVPAEGVRVSVRVQNSQLYPNSPNAQGSEVYSATTDANGNYSVTVKTNGNGNVSGAITIVEMIGTRDTIKNGTTVTGPSASFSGLSTSRIFTKGVNQVLNHTMSATILVGNPEPIVIGTAIVTGTVQIRHIEEDTTFAGVYTYNTFVDRNLPNHLVTLEFDKDPLTQAIRTYTTTTNASGVYTFTVETTNESGFNNLATVKINDYAATRDTIRLNGTVTPGTLGVFGNDNITIGGVDPTEIKNHINVTYSTFQ